MRTQNNTRHASKTGGAPEHRAEVLPLPSATEIPGNAVPGSATWTYEPGIGVWKAGKPVLGWCPTVTRHLATYSVSGNLTARRVTISVGEQEATVPLPDVADGSVWTNRFPVAGVGEKAVRDVLRNIVDDQAAKLPLMTTTPRWVAGRLELPPTDVLPAGYRAVSGTMDDWRNLLREIARSPRMALFVGLAVGGLYVRPLGRQSYTVHLPGASSEGKTTSMFAAASVFGNPEESVIKPWAATAQGIPTLHRAVGTLTAFRDELGSSTLTGERLGQMIFVLMEGCTRDRSDRSNAGLVESPGSWRGALMSTGNLSIVGQVDNEGIAARVIELEGPFTIDADHAESIRHRAAVVHGHGLEVIAERGWTPERFAESAGGMFAEIGADSEKVARRIAWHLSMGAAGAVMLAELVNVPEIAAGIIDTARTVLAEQAQGLAERGARPGDRLLSLVADWVASNPSSFPTREKYVTASGSEFPLRDVFGWDLRGDEPAGEIAIIPEKLKEHAARAGITDLTIALKDLRKDGRLHSDAGKLYKKFRVGSDRVRGYSLSGMWDEPDEVEPTAPTAPEAPAPAPAPAPVQSAIGEGPLEELTPCTVCGEPCRWQYGGVPLHVGCEIARSSAPAPVSIPVPAPVSAPAAPVAPAPVATPAALVSVRTVLALGADGEGLYAGDGEVLEAGDALTSMPALLSRVAEIMPAGGSIAITAEVAQQLGYPDAPPVAESLAAKRKTAKKPVEPVECRASIDGRAGGWLPADSGISAWTTWRQPSTDLRVHVLVVEWSGTAGSSHVLVKPDSTAREAARLLADWRDATGAPYVMTAGITGCNMLVSAKHFGRYPLRKWDAPISSPAAAGVERGFGHVRPVEEWTEAEKAGTHVIGFDMRKAYLAAFAGADFAMDRLEHTGHTGFDRSRAGYWQISQEWKPFPLLPDLRGVKTHGKPGPMWVTTPTADLLLKTGMPEEMITDAWLSARERGHSARIGRNMAEKLRDALRDCEDEHLRAALKSCYREAYGQIQRSTGNVFRRDWADTVIGFSRAALTRNVIRIGEQTGRWPVALDIDCAYYVADSETDNPGFQIEDRPGKFDVKSVQAVSDYLRKGE